MSNVVPMRARAPWKETEDGKLLAQWKWLRTLNADPNVSSAGKHVAFWLLEKFDEGKGYAYPGYASIMEANGIGKRAAMAAIASLEASGWFRVHRFHAGGEGTGGPRSVNHYYPQWGRASQTSAEKALPSAETALVEVQMSVADQCHISTGQCQKSTGQSPKEHWGSPQNDTGAVLKPLPDSTDSTHSTHQSTHETACAPEVSGGGRASAPSRTGLASRKGIVIHPSWEPSKATRDEAVRRWGAEDVELAIDAFTQRHFQDEPVVDPDNAFLESMRPF